MDVQFLPDVDIACPDCGGSRYNRDAYGLDIGLPDGTRITLPEFMELSVDEALGKCSGMGQLTSRLRMLSDVGLGYLTLGESTPGLSGGEAQRLKLASEMGKSQKNTLFVFDEPTIGLHPLDVGNLVGIFRRLVAGGATVVVIEHDLDVIRASDYVIDMGPRGGEEGGRITAAGTPDDIRACVDSMTGRYI